MMQKLCVKNLYASYNNCEILKNVSLELASGEFICICGPNGAGKSTTAASMLQEIKTVRNEKVKIISLEDLT